MCETLPGRLHVVWAVNGPDQTDGNNTSVCVILSTVEECKQFILGKESSHGGLAPWLPCRDLTGSIMQHLKRRLLPELKLEKGGINA